jgi:cytochrome c553
MSRYRTQLSILLLVAGLLPYANSAQAETISSVRLLADNCAICHGTDCMGSFSIPRIKGTMQPQEFMFKMNGFFFGDENATVMGRVAQGLTREEMSELAYFLSPLKR